MVFSTIKSVFSQKNIQLCVSVFQFFSIVSSKRIYTYVWVSFTFFNEEYLPLYEWTKMVFLHLKIFFLEECTPPCECLIEEHLPLLELTILVFSALENVFYLRNIHQSVSVFTFFEFWKSIKKWQSYGRLKLDNVSKDLWCKQRRNEPKLYILLYSIL